MRLNIKKISAIAASALMVGLSMGVAAASTYPAPFVSGGSANVAIVYGTGSGVSSLDLVQAGNIQGNLQSYLTGTTSGATVSGGDSITLATSARKLYYGDSLYSAATGGPISSLTYTELGTVLADGEFTDLSGTTYDYTQTVTIGPATLAFGTSGGDINDPVLYISMDTSTAHNGDLYNYTLSFTKNLNVSDATNVQGQKLKILGVDYVIGSGSTNTTVYLYGSGETLTVTGGESQTVSIAGTDHTIQLVTTADSTHATISVDGVSKSVVEGSNYAFAGDINVYVKDVIHPAYAGDLRQAELIIGANTLKLVNGQTVKKGADETTVKGTLVTVTAGGFGVISGLTISITAPKSDSDSIAIGESFTDPVFGGLKVTLAGSVPALDSTSRGKIVVQTNDNDQAYVTFTSARAGSAGEQKLTYAYDNDTVSTTVRPLLAHSTQSSSGTGKGIIHVLEGENAREDDWIVINQGDAGTILEVDDISIDTSTTGTATFTDAVTGESQKVTLTNGTGGYTKSGVNFFGGTGYTVSVDEAGTAVNITWSSSLAVRTLFPRIKLVSGGWIAFLTESNFTNATKLILPDGVTTLSTTGTGFTLYMSDAAAEYNATLEANGIPWYYVNNTRAIGSLTGNATIKGIGYAGSADFCNFSVEKGPAILYIEPKKWDDSTYGNWICIPMTATTTSEISIGDPVINGTDSGYVTWSSDTYKKQAVDKYGALITKEDRTNQNGVATLNYPASQMYFDVVFSAEGATVTGGGTTSATQLGDVLVKDSEVSSVSSKNLVVVGGSCINSVAANLLGGGFCSADFTAETGIGSGQFLIQSFGDAYSTGKIALLVAGYEAADTVNAATYLRTQTVDTTASKKYKGTSATSATLVTESS
jgi:hypothetical protein